MTGARQTAGAAGSRVIPAIAHVERSGEVQHPHVLMRPGAVLAMQRSAGNAAVTERLQSGRADAPVVQRGDGKSDETRARRAMSKAYTFPFWKLPEGKDVQPTYASVPALLAGVLSVNLGAYVMFSGIQVRFLPDRFMTEKEMTSSGEGTFLHHGKLAGATTTLLYDNLRFDPAIVHTTLIGNQHVVTDYTEPVLTVALQVTYRKRSGVRTLAAARRQRSAYGRGRTLQDHEASHIADAVTFIRDKGPRLANGRGTDALTFNASLKKYYTAASRISNDYGAFTTAQTDCPGRRNATFCMAKESSVK